MNLIFIVIDYLRASHLSYHQYCRRTSPHIDNFTSRGTRYMKHLSNAGWTLPSVCSMLTGILPSQHGAHWENNFLDTKNNPNIPQLLKNNGYSTAAITTNPWISNVFGVMDGIEKVAEIYEKNETFSKHSKGKRIVEFFPPNNGMRKNSNTIIEARRADRVVEKAKQWISDLSSDKYFLYLHFMDCHPDYIPPKHSRGVFERNLSLNDIMLFNKKIRAAKCSRYSEIASPLSSLEIQRTQNLYDECLFGLDWTLGNFLNWLVEKGILEDTVVVLVGDHGTCLGEHEIVGIEANLYNQVLHVPCCIVGPDVPRQQCDKITQSIDLFPTLELLLGIGDGKGFRGLNILDPKLAKSRPVISELYTRKSHVVKHGEILNRRIRACQDGEKKVVITSNGAVETFFIDEQMHEVACSATKCRQIMSITKDNATGFWDLGNCDFGQEKIPQQLENQLRRLGYL